MTTLRTPAAKHTPKLLLELGWKKKNDFNRKIYELIADRILNGRNLLYSKHLTKTVQYAAGYYLKHEIMHSTCFMAGVYLYMKPIRVCINCISFVSQLIAGCRIISGKTSNLRLSETLVFVFQSGLLFHILYMYVVYVTYRS